MRLFSLVVLIFSAYNVYADTSLININGRLIAAPCKINSQSSLLVNLGDTPAARLATKYSATREVPFRVVLDQCPESTSSVIASFSGNTYPEGSNFGYANNGTSKYVGVQLRLSNEPDYFYSNTLSGKSVRLDVDKTNKSIVFDFLTRLWTNSGDVTPGTINSSVTIAFTYQ